MQTDAARAPQSPGRCPQGEVQCLGRLSSAAGGSPHHAGALACVQSPWLDLRHICWMPHEAVQSHAVGVAHAARFVPLPLGERTCPHSPVLPVAAGGSRSRTPPGQAVTRPEPSASQARTTGRRQRGRCSQARGEPWIQTATAGGPDRRLATLCPARGWRTRSIEQPGTLGPVHPRPGTPYALRALADVRLGQLRGQGLQVRPEGFPGAAPNDGSEDQQARGAGRPLQQGQQQLQCHLWADEGADELCGPRALRRHGGHQG